MASDKNFRRTNLLGAAFGLFLLGLWFLLKAHQADLHHMTMRSGMRGAWMDPWQGIVVAVICFAFAAYAIIHAFWSSKGE
jgi:hypothetical protein